MKTFITTLLLVLSVSTQASSLYTGAWSEHLSRDATTDVDTGSRYELNQSHNLIAVEYKTLVIGGFINSFEQETVFATKLWNIWNSDNIAVNLHTGAMYGYTSCPPKGSDHVYELYDRPKVCPVLAPEISYTRWGIQPTVLFLGDAVAFTIKWEL